MIIGKKEQEHLEREQCAQVSLLCRQKLLGYAESFEELGKSFRQEIPVTGNDRQNILEKCMLWQSRQIMGDHLQEVARIMERVAGEELGYRPLEEKKRRGLVQALKSEGIVAKDLCYMQRDGEVPGRTGISMTLATDRPRCKATQVADMLTVLLGKHLQVSSGSPYLVEQEPHCFLFTEEPKYIALTGVSRAVKEGEKISGDQFATMESEKGKLILLLSDGTGSGEDASRGSGRVMDLMEKMLEAGFGTEASVNLLNSALYAQNEEEDHPTVDICSLDLYTGECEICKVGGATTFWKSCRGVECVGGESLPLGIFQKAQIERQLCQIRPGDLLVMVTDGVLDLLEDGEERMAEMLADLRDQNPQEIAEKILSYAICASEGRIRDDMTVFVLCLWENR